MGADALDADLLGRLLDHRPDRPVAQPLSDPAAFAGGALAAGPAPVLPLTSKGLTTRRPPARHQTGE
jgi:hypothetical protein